MKWSTLSMNTIWLGLSEKKVNYWIILILFLFALFKWLHCSLTDDKYVNVSHEPSSASMRGVRRPSKRNKNTKKRNSKSGQRQAAANCKKLDFNVNFVELGWDKWIIFPKIFNAHMCSGDCSLPFKNHNSFFSSSLRSSVVTNHAQIMSILEYKHPDLNKQMTKCVSTKLKPLTVVFLDENGFIKTKQYEDMIVDECGCR